MNQNRIILASEQHRARLVEIIRNLPLGYQVEWRERKTTRNLEQNAKMWAMLADIAGQVEWYGQKLSKESWKDMLTASLKQQTVVPAIDGGGFVVIGAHTSKMSVADMAALIELATAFGCQHKVKWSDPRYDQNS